jgi:hypothetical protein
MLCHAVPYAVQPHARRLDLKTDQLSRNQPTNLLPTIMKQIRTLPQNSLSRLASYSSGAAVGAASLVSSNAAIVYVNAGDQFLVDTTPNNGVSAFFPFDLNSDGVNDLRLRTRIDASSLAMVVAPTDVGSSVSVMGQIITYPYADRLAAGTLIDGSAGFLVLTQAAGNVASMAFGPGYANSQWAFAGQNSGYLGVRFNAGADQHFAWMRLTVEPNNSATPRAITVHEWAYESVPGVGIAAGAIPEPSGLGLLALGSAGLAARRRRVRA